MGYGQTGRFEVELDRIARPPVVPLLPFAVLEGQVEPKLLKRDMAIEVTKDYEHQIAKSVPLGDGGRFRVEVPAGRWRVQATEKQVPRAQLAANVLVAPGQTLSGLTVGPLPPPPEYRSFGGGNAECVDPKSEKKTWFRGTVRDVAGQPIGSATVWALMEIQGGIRSTERIETSITGADGRYEIMGDENANIITSAWLMAHAAARPPAFVGFEHSGRGTGPRPGDRDTNFILADRGGSLEVVVVENGKPIPAPGWTSGTKVRTFETLPSAPVHGTK